jgi:hypothetical protein
LRGWLFYVLWTLLRMFNEWFILFYLLMAWFWLL